MRVFSRPTEINESRGRFACGQIMRRIVALAGGSLRFGCTRWYVLVLSLPLSSLTALAQGYDYYAPRKENADITRLKNVEDYHLGPGQARVAKREYVYAQQEFEFILRYYPNHPVALNLLSDLCEKARVPSCNADPWFEKAIKLNPEAAPTFLMHGLHLHRKRQLEEAVKAYRRAIELAPDSVNAHYNLGLAYVELKQYDLANQHAQKSYQLGAYPPGLRSQLQKAGKWNPNVVPSADPSRAGERAPEAATVTN
jgi:tetratricopeptide (TPR) repeat protein